LEDIAKVIDKYVAQLKKSNSFVELLRINYQINCLFFSTPWQGINSSFSELKRFLIRFGSCPACLDFTNGLLSFKETKTNVPTTACLVSDTDSKEYNSDPCCNSDLLISQCCLPRDDEQAVMVYTGLNSTKIFKCEAAECVESYMSDYLLLIQNALSCNTFSSEVSLKPCDPDVFDLTEDDRRHIHAKLKLPGEASMTVRTSTISTV